MGRSSGPRTRCSRAASARAWRRARCRSRHTRSAAGSRRSSSRRFEKLLEPLRFEAGETIVRKGELADHIYFLVEGEVSVVTELPNGELKRLSTLSVGMTFGELAAVSRAARSADVRADEAAACYALPVESFERLAETNPDIKLVLLENLFASVCQTVARLTHEVATLAQ